MSTDLAVPENGPLSAAEAARQVDQLRKAREFVRLCTADEALDAFNQAQLVREWTRLYKAATGVALEACRLQAAALRRLGQLAPGKTRKGQERNTAEWLATLTDEAFERLIGKMTDPVGPLTLYRAHLARGRIDTNRYEGEQGARGNEVYIFDEPVEENLGIAAYEVLHAAMAGGATTVNDLTVELARRLEINLESMDPESSAMREGIEAVIREALRNESVHGGELVRRTTRGPVEQHLAGHEGHPKWITWRDASGTWRRIPWQAAHLAHLRFMADFRQKQADDTQKSADELKALADLLEQAAERLPGMTSLPDLWDVQAA